MPNPTSPLSPTNPHPPAPAPAAAPGGAPAIPQSALADLDARSQVLRARLSDPEFLQNRGLGNEVGFFTFCYNPACELYVRQLTAQLVRESEGGRLPCRIVERNLYDMLLDICRERRILDRIPQQEERRGQEALRTQLQKVASAEAFAKAVDYVSRQPSDVVFLTGVGEVYPFLRVHVLLDNLQHLAAEVPVIVFYPGKFTGQSLSLFGRLDDGNYYRAFDLI